MRNSSSIAGALVLADGRSTLATVLLALDAQVTLKLTTADSMTLGEYLPRRNSMKPGYLITAVKWTRDAVVEFDAVARTPADHPIVAVGIGRWPSGRTRVAVGGWGSSPLVAMDGPDSEGIEIAVRNALHELDDAWGSASYRMDVAAVLARRCWQPAWEIALIWLSYQSAERSYFQRCSASPDASLNTSRSCCVKSNRQLPDCAFRQKRREPLAPTSLPLLVGI